MCQKFAQNASYRVKRNLNKINDSKMSTSVSPVFGISHTNIHPSRPAVRLLYSVVSPINQAISCAGFIKCILLSDTTSFQPELNSTRSQRRYPFIFRQNVILIRYELSIPVQEYDSLHKYKIFTNAKGLKNQIVKHLTTPSTHLDSSQRNNIGEKKYNRTIRWKPTPLGSQRHVAKILHPILSWDYKNHTHCQNYHPQLSIGYSGMWINSMVAWIIKKAELKYLRMGKCDCHEQKRKVIWIWEAAFSLISYSKQ